VASILHYPPPPRSRPHPPKSVMWPLPAAAAVSRLRRSDVRGYPRLGDAHRWEGVQHGVVSAQAASTWIRGNTAMAEPESVFIYVGTYPDQAAARDDYQIINRGEQDRAGRGQGRAEGRKARRPGTRRQTERHRRRRPPSRIGTELNRQPGRGKAGIPGQTPPAGKRVHRDSTVTVQLWHPPEPGRFVARYPELPLVPGGTLAYPVARLGLFPLDLAILRELGRLGSSSHRGIPSLSSVDADRPRRRDQPGDQPGREDHPQPQPAARPG
jgi:hypothetical protein